MIGGADDEEETFHKRVFSKSIPRDWEYFLGWILKRFDQSQSNV